MGSKNYQHHKLYAVIVLLFDMLILERQPAEDPQAAAGNVICAGSEIAARETSRVAHTTTSRIECG